MVEGDKVLAFASLAWRRWQKKQRAEEHSRERKRVWWEFELESEESKGLPQLPPLLLLLLLLLLPWDNRGRAKRRKV